MIPFLGPADPFPPVEQALDEPDGLLAAGGGLSVERLVDAYRRGIFPWYGEGDPVLWWSPDPRTVLAPADLHISRSLARRLRKRDFRVTADAAFQDVLAACAGPRTGETGTWLSTEMRHAYVALHEAGLAHSIEVWTDDVLTGGIYGVLLGRMFFGESMFSRRPDGSKIAMAYLAAQLTRWEVPLIDCQMETSHLVSLGATTLPRRRFVEAVRRWVDEPRPAWILDADLCI